MIDLYSWNTPNGHKVHIVLEELGLEYRLHPVDLGAGAQREPEFRRFNPYGKIPAIVDHDGPAGRAISLFESGAILLYLAETRGRLLPTTPEARWQVVQWLMFQMAGVGPMMGQLAHFSFAAPETIPYAVERYLNEVERVYRVVEERLAEREFLADDYSIADIACFPWLRRHARLGIDAEPYPHLRRWLETVGGRPAVQRGLALMV